MYLNTVQRSKTSFHRQLYAPGAAIIIKQRTEVTLSSIIPATITALQLQVTQKILKILTTLPPSPSTQTQPGKTCLQSFIRNSSNKKRWFSTQFSELAEPPIFSIQLRCSGLLQSFRQEAAEQGQAFCSTDGQLHQDLAFHTMAQCTQMQDFRHSATA